MWWGIGGGLAVIWIILLIVCGITCFRKGHWILGILGVFFPLFWLIGAVLDPTSKV